MRPHKGVTTSTSRCGQCLVDPCGQLDEPVLVYTPFKIRDTAGERGAGGVGGGTGWLAEDERAKEHEKEHKSSSPAPALYQRWVIAALCHAAVGTAGPCAAGMEGVYV